MAISHRPARKVRRTSRTAFERWPSAVAIIGEDAVISPSRNRLKVQVRLSASVAAASWVAPSRPISRTSVAWITCCVTLARISGQASASVARKLAEPRADFGRAVDMLAAASMARRLARKRRASKRFGPLRTSASRWREPYRGHCNEVRARNLEAAGRDQGRARPAPHAAVLRQRFTRRCRRARRRSATASSTSTSTGSVVEQPSHAELVRRRERRPARANIACATSSRRSTRRATTTASRRSRSTSTASPAAAQTAIGDLADAVRRVRAAGKPVIAYGVGYTDDSYQLASAASEIWLNPLGAVLIAGPGGIEPLLQGPARQARGHRQRLSRRHLQVGGRAVHPQRHVARSEAELPGARPGRARNLAQRGQAGTAQGQCRSVPDEHAMAPLRRRAATWPRPRSRAGWSTRSATAATSRQRLARARRQGRRQERRRLRADQARLVRRPTSSTAHPKGPIGVVTIAGMIVDGKAGPEPPAATPSPRKSTTGSRQRHQGAGRARRQPRRVGARVRAHPPGAARRQGEEDPGRGVDGQRRRVGRLLGLDPGDFIYAEPSTITGSIGVFGVIPSFQGTLQKLGIGADGVKTTPLSGEPDLLKGPRRKPTS